MKTVCIDNLINEIKACVDRHRLDAHGKYARFANEQEVNEYGVADAANILYTVGAFPRDPLERAGFINTLQSLQDPQTGTYTEATHHVVHTTAHCIAALELFDTSPLYPIRAFEAYTTREGLYELFEKELPWEDPWTESHRGAGMFVCLTQTGAVDLQWKDDYFAWLWEHTDRETGFFCYDKGKDAPIYRLMAGGFHYLFNHESEHRPLRYPERVIDSCIAMMRNPSLSKGKMLRECTFIDIDVVYCLTRAMRQTAYRFEEGKAELEKYAERYIEMMNSIDYQNDKHFNDLHMLFGAVCCLAELQSALPGKIRTAKPLRLVLDRRPFI